MTVSAGTRTLVLNDDRLPLCTCSWKKAIKRIYSQDKDSAIVIEYYDIWFRDSKQREHAVPAVICNKHHVKRNYRKVSFSRKNVFRRDGFYCQYCGNKFTRQNLTVDHVVPRSMWSGEDSPTCWHNLATACYDCNSRKRDRTPEQANMPLKKIVNGKVIPYKRPKKPNYVEIVLGSSSIDVNNIPEEWKTYIEYLVK